MGRSLIVWVRERKILTFFLASGTRARARGRVSPVNLARFSLMFFVTWLVGIRPTSEFHRVIKRTVILRSISAFFSEVWVTSQFANLSRVSGFFGVANYSPREQCATKGRFAANVLRQKLINQLFRRFNFDAG